MSNVPGYQRSGMRSYVLVSKDSVVSIAYEPTAYRAAPAMYSTPCKTNHVKPICLSSCSYPYRWSPCNTGTTALNPIATNMKARRGRHSGERNFGCSTARSVPAPIVVICS